MRALSIGRHVSVGPERAPHRSRCYAMGLTPQPIAQPVVGVASCWNAAAPCKTALMRQVQAVKNGVSAAAGTARLDVVDFRQRRSL